MKNGLILGLLIGLLILQFVSISEFLYLKIRFKKYNRRLTIFNFLFHYYDIIHDIKSLEEIERYKKVLERKNQ